MGLVQTVTCDDCGRDITGSRTGNLVLDCAPPSTIASSGCGVLMTHLVHVEPQLDRPHYFCDILCLAQWAYRKWDKPLPDDVAGREESDK
jgi:hypothetical protein